MLSGGLCTRKRPRGCHTLGSAATAPGLAAGVPSGQDERPGNFSPGPECSAQSAGLLPGNVVRHFRRPAVAPRPGHRHVRPGHLPPRHGHPRAHPEPAGVPLSGATTHPIDEIIRGKAVRLEDFRDEVQVNGIGQNPQGLFGELGESCPAQHVNYILPSTLHRACPTLLRIDRVFRPYVDADGRRHTRPSRYPAAAGQLAAVPDDSRASWAALVSASGQCQWPVAVWRMPPAGPGGRSGAFSQAIIQPGVPLLDAWARLPVRSA